MDREEIPRYTGYTDEEIKEMEKVNQEIGSLQERQERLEEELFNLRLQMAHNEIGEVK